MGVVRPFDAFLALLRTPIAVAPQGNTVLMDRS